MPRTPDTLISLEDVFQVIKNLERADAKQANDIASALQRCETWAIINKEGLNARAQLLMQFAEQVSRLRRFPYTKRFYG